MRGPWPATYSEFQEMSVLDTAQVTTLVATMLGIVTVLVAIFALM